MKVKTASQRSTTSTVINERATTIHRYAQRDATRCNSSDTEHTELLNLAGLQPTRVVLIFGQA
jgi:uncharacterized protein YciW